MDCAEARRVLWPPEGLRVVGDDVLEARAHAQSCPGCIDYFQQDRTLLDLYDRARKVSAPMSVRERVFDAIASARWVGRRAGASGERGPDGTEAGPHNVRSAGVDARGPLVRGLRKHGGWLMAAAAFLVVGVASELRHHPAPTEASDVFVQDYLRRAVGQEYIESDDRREVSRFLERELGIRLDPLDLTGFQLTRAEICLLEGQRGAMIVYQGAGATVSHYVVPRAATAPRSPSLSTSPGESMAVVTWATRGTEQALVGEMEPEGLLRLAGESLR